MSIGRAYLIMRRWIRYRADSVASMMRWKRLSFRDSPVILGNAMPKSGTNLLRQIFEAIPRVAPYKALRRWTIRTITESGRTRPEEEVLRDLGRLQAGDIALARLFASEGSLGYLTRPDVVGFVLIRDPRDLLISHVYYATKIYEGHAMHEKYMALPDFEDRLSLAIKGTRDHPHSPSVRDRYERYLGFLNVPEISVLRFEDLRLNLGKSVRGILEKIQERGGIATDDLATATSKVISRISSARSPTFRKGLVGEWKQHFTSRTESEFRETAGDLLQELGYEKAQDWTW